jgi:hypothetical protein
LLDAKSQPQTVATCPPDVLFLFSVNNGLLPLVFPFKARRIGEDGKNLRCLPFETLLFRSEGPLDWAANASLCVRDYDAKNQPEKADTKEISSVKARHESQIVSGGLESLFRDLLISVSIGFAADI